MTKVKICGITSLKDATMAADLGVDAIGFNFYHGSKRYISPDDAATIIGKTTMRVEKFGVFVNASVEEIIQIEGFLHLDTIQLHGEESPKFIEQLRLESDATIIKAVRIGPNFEPNEALKYKADAILVDAYSEDERGGTGRVVDWAIARQIAGSVEHVYLAGGLTPEDVTVAIHKVSPFAVDVASGVESSPGIKDSKKVEAFISAVRRTAAS